MHFYNKILEIAKRPHLWNVERPNLFDIVEELKRDGVYSQSYNLRDGLFHVERYVEIIKTIQSIITNSNGYTKKPNKASQEIP